MTPVARPGRVAALPRSRLHIQFLLDNGATPDLILYRDEDLEPVVAKHFGEKCLFLGREKRPGRSVASLLDARRENRLYYDQVRAKVSDLGLDRLILFLEGEPLERFLIANRAARRFELWEDGLSHYVDLTSPAWYVARAAAQAAAGFYARGIWKRRIDRSTLIVRDRFERKNLRLAAPGRPAETVREILFVGSPLVEDGLVSPERFGSAMLRIADASPLPVRYLLHPRESEDRLTRALSGHGRLIVDANRDGLLKHVGERDYAAYLSALSTGIFDIGRLEKSLFTPGLFGLKRAQRALAGWAANPVQVASTDGEVRDFLREACGSLR